jgi:hypothetical protein
MTMTSDREVGTPAVTPQEIAARRLREQPTDRVVFRVSGLYGISKEGARFPVSATESIDTGTVALVLDPDGGASGNLGIIDFDKLYLRVRYNVAGVFPALHDLVMSGKHDLSLLGPLRATATDECRLSDDLTGWRALGCMDFLPGSLWAGASGG